MTVPMLMMPQPAARTRFADWPFAVKSIVGFWCFYGLTVVARAFLGTDPWTTLKDKLVIIAIGIALTILLWSGAASAATRVCVSVQQKSWYRRPPPGSWP